MKVTHLCLTIGILLLCLTANAQGKYTATATVTVYGNCEQCKNAIETAARSKNSSASWHSDNHSAVITYDSTRTNLSAVLKKIALAGYDNAEFLAPDNSYEQLPACCRYQRTAKKATTIPAAHPAEQQATPPANAHPLSATANAYFELKEALINNTPAVAATKAKALLEALDKVAMEQLSQQQHNAWMQQKAALAADAANIAQLTDIEKQRIRFSALSGNLYTVFKAGGIGQTIYYQHCPMFNGGADWLSKDKTIRNPFYGDEMLSCGKTQATIQ